MQPYVQQQDPLLPDGRHIKYTLLLRLDTEICQYTRYYVYDACMLSIWFGMQQHVQQQDPSLPDGRHIKYTLLLRPDTGIRQYTQYYVYMRMYM